MVITETGSCPGPLLRYLAGGSWALCQKKKISRPKTFQRQAQLHGRRRREGGKTAEMQLISTHRGENPVPYLGEDNESQGLSLAGVRWGQQQQQLKEPSVPAGHRASVLHSPQLSTPWLRRSEENGWG